MGEKIAFFGGALTRRCSFSAESTGGAIGSRRCISPIPFLKVVRLVRFDLDTIEQWLVEQSSAGVVPAQVEGAGPSR